MSTGKHNHAEAFALMWYKCQESCGHMERIWNSRDGVTPFGCRCPSCGGTMSHIAWGADRMEPNYQLIKYQKFWRDGTKDEALAIMHRRFELYPTDEDTMQTILGEIEKGRSMEFPKGWPYLDVHLG